MKKKNWILKRWFLGCILGFQLFYIFINILDKDIRCIVIKLKKGKILGN